MSLSCDPPQAESFASETLSECVGNHVGRKERGGMMITLDEAKELGKGYKVVPISKEILSDIRTPIEVLRILKGVSRHCYMLESVEHQERWGRYTFLGYDPKMEITCMNGSLTIRNGSTKIKTVEHPGEGIKESEGGGTSDIYRWTGGIFLL